jgi:hypothetical protein
MAYQIPRFAFLHAAADAGAANLSSDDEDTDFPLENLIDGRPSSLFKFDSSGSHYVIVDRGTQPMSEAVGRIIIPAGHNLAAATLVRVHSSTTGAWGGEETLRKGWDQTGESDPDGIIDQDFTAETTDRYLRFYVLTPAGTTWEFGQLYFTRTRQATTAGPEPRWTDQPESISVVRELWSRSATSLYAANRRRYSFRTHILESTDLSVYDELFTAVSDSTAFYMDPPDDTETPRFVKIAPRTWRRTQDHPAPASGGPTYTISFEMLEQMV